MEPSPQDRKLGRIALKEKLISKDQLGECMAEQADAADYLPLGLLLIRKGYLDDQQLMTLSDVLERQLAQDQERRRGVIQDILLAPLVIQRGLISSAQLSKCLELQAAEARAGSRMRLGQIMVREKMIATDVFVDLLQDDYCQEFRCDQCQTPFDLGLLEPGATVTCKQCQGLASVPTMEQMLTLLQSGEHMAQPRPKSGKKKRAKRKRKTTRPKPTRPPPPVEDELEDVPSLDLGLEGLSESEAEHAPTLVQTLETAPEAGGKARVAQMLTEGQIGQYELLDEIATGGMGIVFKARQAGLNRIVALKVLKEKSDASSEQVQRFQREARAASLMKHQNIVSIIEVGRTDRGLHYMVMDYLEGLPLDEIIAEDGRVEPKRAMRMMEAITDAIAYAHSCNVVHRDLKPSNVIISPDDQPHITDFGLAKRLDSKSKLTETGALVGTPYYMAPEQILEGSQGVKKSWDVYALGVLLYEMLTGQLPFNGETTMEVYHQILNEEPRPPRQLVRVIPPAVERICMKALIRDEAARYRSVAEMNSDVTAYLEGRQVSARPRGWVGRLRRRYEMNTLLYTIIACSGIIVVGILCILGIRWWKEQQAQPAANRSSALEQRCPEFTDWRQA